ncbi:Regulator of G protein signalling superfamily [Lasallia pustulata]|uniref:Regulator of G protein signalling superfamily n=1 Tax=Lasallia pustulata TaxID=136370 RepID=A0A1W5DBP0_9LECA|nr:Regulator of G protein signalling superfamily [Lasallia pustulata]
MIFRKTSPPSSYLSSPSPELSPRCSTVLSDCDADDEATMYPIDEFTPSRPLGVATLHQQANGPYCPRRPTLQEVLSNIAPPPWTLSAFTAYLSQNHCLETLEFTMDAERYQLKYDAMAEHMVGMPMSSDVEECGYVMMLWQRLLDAYIVPDGPREVNLPSNVRDALLSIPNHTAPPSPDVLDDAVKIIYELMDESVLVPFLNEMSHRGSQSYSNTWTDSDENVYLRGSPDDHSSGRRSSSSRRRASPPASALEGPTSLSLGRSSTSRHSTTSTLSLGLSRSRHHQHSSGATADQGLTDDSGSSSSPGKDSPVTPPTTPPAMEMGGGSPRSHRGDGTWRKMTGMTGRLGWKKKSSSGIRDSRFPTIEDEGNL